MKKQYSTAILSLSLASVLALSVIACERKQETTTTPAPDTPPAPTTMPVPSTSIGTKIDDGVVTTRVKSALLADPDIKSFDIGVETREAEVQLSGFVDNQAQMDRAVEIARGIEGVKNVANKMSLKK